MAKIDTYALGVPSSDFALLGHDAAGNVKRFSKSQLSSLFVGSGAAGSGPTITTPATIAQAENGVFSLALAADEECTWEIVGGPDANLFDIVGTAGGDQTFDFEAPADADGNNIYQIIVKATGMTSGLSTEKTITLTVSDVFEPSALNPAAKTSNVTLSNSNFTATNVGGGDGAVQSTTGKIAGAGKYVVKFTASGSNFGIGLGGAQYPSPSGGGHYSGSPDGTVMLYSNGNILYNFTNPATGVAPVSGFVAFDFVAKTIRTSADGNTWSGPYSFPNDLTGRIFLGVFVGADGDTATVSFAPTGWALSGYTNWDVPF